MLYLLAILLPPVAVLAVGKPFQALINVGLTLLLWIPGVIHALLVVNNHYADVRTGHITRELRTMQDIQLAPRRAQAALAQRTARADYLRGIGACPSCGYKRIAGKAACPMCRAPLDVPLAAPREDVV